MQIYKSNSANNREHLKVKSEARLEGPERYRATAATITINIEYKKNLS